MKAKISYDKENDILYYNKGKKGYDSLELGNAFLEFSSDGKIAGIEIMNASDFLSELTDEEITSEILDNVVAGKISLRHNGDYAFIVFEFIFEKENEKIKETVNFNIPAQAATA